jgi:hypothetical protein
MRVAWEVKNWVCGVGGGGGGYGFEPHQQKNRLHK